MGTIITPTTKAGTGHDQELTDEQAKTLDEVHTPDSSRLWLAQTYMARFSEGKNPDTFDKEILRCWFAEQGFRGEGEIPV